jgi:hypothetical protein
VKAAPAHKQINKHLNRMTTPIKNGMHKIVNHLTYTYMGTWGISMAYVLKLQMEIKNICKRTSTIGVYPLEIMYLERYIIFSLLIEGNITNWIRVFPTN